MPLIVLGLLLIIGIAVYSIIKYMNSGETDTRSVRERYPHAFPPKKGGRPHSDYPDGPGDIKHTEDGNIIFPSENVEKEKLKRNIH